MQAAMERAPYGLGEATLLDTQVRDSWQLGPEKLRLENKEFVEAVEEKLVERIKAELGLGEDVEVRAELHKLLLYNPGGHFKAHRDTEKAAGMFGTLILQLPSEFTGGDLVVRHGGEEVVVAMAQAGAATSCVFAAHYSDCEHELREVTSGHRLALVHSGQHDLFGATVSLLVFPFVFRYAIISRICIVLHSLITRKRF